MASAKEIALLERKLKSAKTNREKIVLAKELKELKSKLTTTQKQDSLPTQRRKIRMLSSAEFNELIARLKQKPEYSFLKSMGKKKIEDDYRVVGKPVGWRIKGKDNYKVPSKRFRQENPDLVYFENRINRSDVRKPNRLEHGGNLYKLKDGENVWYLTYLDSTHFFLSNSQDFKGNPYHIGQFRGRPFYDEVDEWLKSETRKRHSYETGGEINSTWVNIMNDYGFKKGRGRFGTDVYTKGDLVVYINEKARLVEMKKKAEPVESYYPLYKGYSVQAFLDELTKHTKNAIYETGGSLKKKIVKHPKAFKIDLDVESRMGNNEHFEVGKIKGYGDALVSRSALQHNAPDNYKYSVKPTNKYEDGGEIESSARLKADNPNWTNEKLLAEYNKNKVDLQNFNNGFLKPSKVIGGGYKSSAIAKKLAKKWLEDKIAEYGMALKMRGVMATGGGVKKKDLVEYVVPNWSVPCLINGDYSGLSDEDEKSLDEFTERVKNDCGNAFFMLGEKSDDYGFSDSNDVDNYAGDVTTLYINPDNSYARGGGVKKKGKSQPAVTSNAVQPKYSDYNVQLVESQDEDNKGTYYMFPKPADINSKGILFEKGGEIKVGDWVAEKKGTARGKVYQDTGKFIKLEDKYGNKSTTLHSKSDFKRSVKPRY